ncbi:cobalamin-binding protein [Thalassotalea sp. LPB0316]|uniref:cobalamin-binding protein n=1 Tax=Thalassotalea sp. LPB0316 TaxID=2769490 RepID=UPI0018660347|nr:cobalamin-binding protein [Thalassotalea sp. LPB0316]QOL25935.1 cobalamin-binding protein [Thalassotalea sp. LPB0316]
MKHCVLCITLLCGLLHGSLQAKPFKLVALSPHTVEMLYDLGLGDNIVATVEHADYPEQAKAIPRIGGAYGLSIEKVLALRPDYVIAWRGGNKAADLAKLEQLGIAIIDSSPQNITEVAQDYRRIGQQLNRAAQGDAIAQTIELSFRQLKAQYQDKTPVNVFYQMWPEPLMTINQSTWTHQLLSLCGASNVFATQLAAYPQISIEHVIAKQPEVIVLPWQHSKTGQGEQQTHQIPAQLMWQPWSQIPAVKQQQFVHADADLLHRFTKRVLAGVTQLCHDIDQYR